MARHPEAATHGRDPADEACAVRLRLRMLVGDFAGKAGRADRRARRHGRCAVLRASGAPGR